MFAVDIFVPDNKMLNLDKARIQAMSQHSHCQNCFKTNCKITRQSQDACVMMKCCCGFKLHECKIEDHLELCDKVKVACINQAFGCELFLRRENMNLGY